MHFDRLKQAFALLVFKMLHSFPYQAIRTSRGSCPNILLQLLKTLHPLFQAIMKVINVLNTLNQKQTWLPKAFK
ncbi:hypothetical protein UP15_14220 [Bacillus pumilus]|nr:hypothetical protein UP15_14220 [Bacillus pumilus]KQL40738.1 hypothetical protein AN962_14875 [Bacillus sp. FJAT-21955]